jgi:hypothetical protein
MAVYLSPVGGAGAQFFDNNGVPLSGGKLYTYIAGTTTPQTTYTSSAGTVAHANPIVLDSAGRVSGSSEVWLSVGASYKFVLKTSNDVLIGTWDNIFGNGDPTFNQYTPNVASLLAPGPLTVKSALDQITNEETGSSVVGFMTAGAGAIPLTVEEKLSQMVSVADFGATGDGSTDDYQAFVDALTAASGGAVFVPNPSVSYRIGTGKITVPANTQLVGAARHRTQLNHAYNGVMFELSDGAGLQNLWLVGDGANYTGRAITYTGTNGRQGVIGVRASDWEDEVQYFAVAAGSQSFTQDCRFSRRNAGTTTNRFAIVIDPAQQLGAVPRSFIGIQTDGTCSFDFGGCNNVYITNSFVGDLKYTGESRAVLINNTRIANQLALTIDGNNNTIVGCDIAPQITIASTTDNVALQGNSYNNLPVINNSGNSRNLIDTYYRPYTPTLTSGGTAPSLGNGTIVGGVCTSGATTTITGILTIGSTTSLGTGGLKISLPQQRQSGDVVVGGIVYASIGGVVYQGFMQIAGGVSVADMLRDVTGSITFNSPAVFAAGDFIRWSLTYPT